MEPNPNAFIIHDLKNVLKECQQTLDNHHLTKNKRLIVNRYKLTSCEYSKIECKIKVIKAKLILLGVNPDEH